MCRGANHLEIHPTGTQCLQHNMHQGMLMMGNDNAEVLQHDLLLLYRLQRYSKNFG